MAKEEVLEKQSQYGLDSNPYRANTRVRRLFSGVRAPNNRVRKSPQIGAQLHELERLSRFYFVHGRAPGGDYSVVTLLLSLPHISIGLRKSDMSQDPVHKLQRHFIRVRGPIVKRRNHREYDRPGLSGQHHVP